MDVREKIKTFLEKNEVLALATTDGHEVSVCNLHYYSDEMYNLYFVSRSERQHTKNIERHKEVSVCIYDPNYSSENIVIGLQLKGICTLYKVNDGMEQMQAYYDKFPEKFAGETVEIRENLDFRSFYKIETKWVRVIDGHSWDLPHEITL